MTDDKTRTGKSEPGSEAAEPSPVENNTSKEADNMYRDAAKKLAHQGADDPQKAAELAKPKP